MNTDYIRLLSPENDYAIRIRPPSQPEQRIPTHFILVIDASESMSYANKLENVKHSASLVLHFLGAQDRLTLITFGNESTIYCSALSCDNKEVLMATIDGIHTDGCTNLSAGFVRIKEVLDDLAVSRPSDLQMKTGVLLLTDGNANRGVTAKAGIISILTHLLESYSALSFHFVGYGTEHNAELLKDMACAVQGSYSIITDREGAATVIGDTLGGLFSCVAQTVTIKCPDCVTVHGQYTLKNGAIHVGDMYEGTEPIILFRGGGGSVTVQGVSLPSMKPFSTTISEPVQQVERDSGIETTFLRYTCSALFKKVRQLSRPSEVRPLELEIQAFKAKLADEFFAENQVADMLRGECRSLEDAFRQIQTSAHSSDDLSARILQHETFVSLGRGTSQGISHAPSHDEPGAPSPAVSQSNTISSPYRGRTQRRVTTLMTAMSMASSEEVTEALEEAAVYSQAAL
jgi:hypothetical protein